MGALPGYKGPDVYSRGERVEDQAYYFIPELEQVIREWVATMYHLQPHEGLLDPGGARVGAQPAGHVRARRGPSRAVAGPGPPRPGVRLLAGGVADSAALRGGTHGLVYNGDALGAYRNARSGYRGANPGKWPIRYDPDDITRSSSRTPTTANGTP